MSLYTLVDFSSRACEHFFRTIDPTRRDILTLCLEQCIKSLFSRSLLLFKRSLSAPSSEVQPSVLSSPNSISAASSEGDVWDGWDLNARERLISLVSRFLEFRTINCSMNNLLVCYWLALDLILLSNHKFWLYNWEDRSMQYAILVLPIDRTHEHVLFS